jgi:hypothetical protein
MFQLLTVAIPANADTAAPRNPNFLHNVGTIEVLVMRCRAHLDDVALPMRSSSKQEKTGKDVSNSVRRHHRSVSAKSAPAKAKTASPPPSELGGLFGLFDGANDVPDILDGSNDMLDIFDGANGTPDMFDGANDMPPLPDKLAQRCQLYEALKRQDPEKYPANLDDMSHRTWKSFLDAVLGPETEVSSLHSALRRDDRSKMQQPGMLREP